MFKTKGEFIQTLKDYDLYKTKLDTLKVEYEKLDYIRFNKVKSPLDYDVVGYKDGEQMRSLKTRSYTSNEQIAQRNESLDKQLEQLEKKITSYESTIKEVDAQLKTFKEPFRSVIVYRYIKGNTYNATIIKFPNLFPAGYPNAVKRYIENGLDKMFK